MSPTPASIVRTYALRIRNSLRSVIVSAGCCAKLSRSGALLKAPAASNPTQHLAPVPPRRVHFGLRNAFMKSSTSGAAISAISCAVGCGAHGALPLERHAPGQETREVPRQRRDVEVAVVCMRLENVLEHRIGLLRARSCSSAARLRASASPRRRSAGAAPCVRSVVMMPRIVSATVTSAARNSMLRSVASSRCRLRRYSISSRPITASNSCCLLLK